MGKTMITVIWGFLASKWLSWIGIVAKAIWTGISYFFRGLSFLQNPFEIFTVGVLLIVTFGLGAGAMHAFVGHRVKTVEAQMTALWRDMSNKDREDAQRAAEARAARVAAETAERQRQINATNTKKLPDLYLMGKPAAHPAGAANSAHPPVVAGVRDKPAKVRGRKCEQGLFGCL
jgi:hypothetical protein